MKKKQMLVLGLIFMLTISYILPFINDAIPNSSDRVIENNYPSSSAQRLDTKQWIENPNFTSTDNWASSKGSLGDSEDVNASIRNGVANYDILGEKRIFSLVADPPLETDWNETENPAFPSLPDISSINEKGCEVYHHWSEGADQSPSVHWYQDITMPVNFSDYVITSASLKAVVNGTVKADNGNAEGVEAVGDAVEGGTQYATYDYARFYVLISDLKKNKVYEVAYNQTTDLGKDSAGDEDYMTDTSMIVVPEESLIFFLTSVLNTDNYNFTITLGIRIWCEDNWSSDDDFWESLVINYINLTFNYEKKINQLTSVSWNQIADKISDISNYTVVVTDAKLNFKYKIDQNWPTSLSPNSEIRVLINDNKHTETIKLSIATTSFQEAKLGGFDVSNLITEDLNLSLQVFIADEFGLSQNIIISIDDVSLYISYIIIEPDEPGPDLGWLIYIITGAMIGLIVVFTLYQTHFKYPPMVRKIRKVKKKINKDKKIKPTSSLSRELLVAKNLQDKIKFS